jgi:hypothetical protein
MQDRKKVRLQSDFEKIETLVVNSGGTLRLVRCSGSPPTSYLIEYHCPSLVKDVSGVLVTRQQHQVEIILGANYPFEKPTARMITPVFNPHVFESNAICLGVVWNAAETLNSLILKLGALLQLDPKVLDAKSPANSEANNWVKKNFSKLPIGTISFISSDSSDSNQKRIQWN